MEQIRISAKNLGALAMPEFCARCLWVKLRVDKLPFQIFPGIFSSIDSYSKKVVHGHFDTSKKMPEWLSPLGKLKGYKNPPHFSKFSTVVEKHNVLLTGTPDGVSVREDDSNLIVDYKTAKFTGTQDELLPMYETQLNVYAIIGKDRGFDPVSGLALIYFEPVTGEDAAKNNSNLRADGFAMGFSTHILNIQMNTDRVLLLVERLRQIADSQKPPVGREGCKDCVSIQHIVKVLG